MKLDNEYKNGLISRYRCEIFETDDVALSEIDELVPNDELKAIVQLNNRDIAALVSKKPFDKELAKRLFVANVNFYKLAKSRGIPVNGSSLLMRMAKLVDYDANKLYDELSVGRHSSLR